MRDSKDIIEIADYKSLEKTSPVFIWIVFKKLGLKVANRQQAKNGQKWVGCRSATFC